jgi:hypothetical protein
MRIVCGSEDVIVTGLRGVVERQVVQAEQRVVIAPGGRLTDR